MSSLWFLRDEEYLSSFPLPTELREYQDLSLVRVFSSGKTQPGWGAESFIENYNAKAFEPDRALRFYRKWGEPFGIVMRSVDLICVDIDGKNGGIETSQVLDLPETLAETSKSGNGYHLYYKTSSLWDPKYGHNQHPDVIGLIPGVDIKGTGIVYHYPQQRWNDRPIAMLPQSLNKLVGNVRDSRLQARATLRGVPRLDPEDQAIVHDQLREELARPVVTGTRNNTLYKIGAKMFVAGVPGWEELLQERGDQLGLGISEVEMIIRNITAYS